MPAVLYVHNGTRIPCPVPSEDLLLRISRSVHGWGHKQGGLNKTDVWFVLEMAAKRGHISFQGRVRGGQLGMKRKSGQLRSTLRKNILDVARSWAEVVRGSAVSCESCGSAV